MKQEEENINVSSTSIKGASRKKKSDTNKTEKKEKKSSDTKKKEKKETSDKKKKEEKKKKEKDKKEKVKKEKKEKKDKKEKTIENDEIKENESSENEISEISSDSIYDSSSDSIYAADSLAMDSGIVRVDSTTTTEKDTTTITVPPAYMSGNTPMSRTNHPGHDSGIMILLSATFILVSYSFNLYKRLLIIYGQELWTVRRRANAFDAHTTNERNVLVILIFQLCVYAGILISAKINTLIPINTEKIMLTTCCMMGVYALYYLFQLATYSLVGYVFTDKINTAQWIKGFNSSHIFLGFSLIIPTMVSIFYPTSTNAMVTLSIVLYVIARLTFIFKGFRIFYNKIHSLFYFILYLCTLEIIPVIFAYDLAQKIITNLQ